MNLPEYSLRNGRVVGFFLALLLVGGVAGFSTLGKKEDSTFVIKSASLICTYPGATPREVEELVTEPIEREVQSMRSVHKITSESWYGLSKIQVELDPGTPAREIPQLWDELRRKALDIQPKLPAEASAITVADDFGDVYGIYYGLSADEGFTDSELRDWAQRLKRALVTLDGVQKVILFGEQSPVVNVYVSLSALANFSIRPETIVQTIAQQNAVVDSGEKQAGEMEIRILEEGSYRSLGDLENQLLFSASGRQYRLGDLARIERGWADPPQTLMRVNGDRAVGIGISTEAGADVVRVGARIEELLDALTVRMPVGMELTVLYPENRIAREATRDFLLNLAESVAIVIAVIMLVMGFCSGMLIGSSLLFSIGGTLLLMQFAGEGLNRTSLAGFIIAMGMLVDNAIVVTDNARQAMLRGIPRRRAFVEGANAPRWSLLGATLIAVFSFLPLYLAPSSVAEIVRPLFVVVALSLGLSWVLALTQTPLFGVALLRVAPSARDPYDTPFYRAFDRLLAALLRHRAATVTVVAGIFAASLWTMGRMPQNFFPALDKPYFRADVLLPEGYNIRDTEQTLAVMEAWLRGQPEVKTVSATAGSTPPRYYLASGSTSLRPNFGNLLVELHDSRSTAPVEERFNGWVAETFPDVWLRSSLFKLSPVPDAAIEFGFIGEHADTLRRLTAAAEAVMWRTPGATNIRNSWGNRIPTWQPLYSPMKGQRIGITRSQLARGLTIATQGYALGTLREGDLFLLILLKDENIAAYNLTNLQALPIFNPAGKVFSIGQATDGFRFDFRSGVIRRFDRQRVMKAQCDPARGVNTLQLFNRLYDSIRRAVPLPEGYAMRIFGEQESQQESNAALARYLPLTRVLIFIVLLLLFRNYRDPAVILLMIPLIFIGVVFGLAVTGKVFNFFSLLGLLGLVGMNIKNAVVLVEQIRELRAGGHTPREALVEAARSRIVPVTMASGPPFSACCRCCSTRCSAPWPPRSWAGCSWPRSSRSSCCPSSMPFFTAFVDHEILVADPDSAARRSHAALRADTPGAYLARGVPHGRCRLQPRPEDCRRGQPRRLGGGCRCPDGLPAASCARGKFYVGFPLSGRCRTLELRRAAPTGPDPLRRWRRSGRGRPRRAGARHCALRGGLLAPRRALCRRVRLLEPLGRRALRRVDARICGADPFAQGGGRPALRGGVHRPGRRADDRCAAERGGVFAGERRAEPRGGAPQLQHPAGCGCHAAGCSGRGDPRFVSHAATHTRCGGRPAPSGLRGGATAHGTGCGGRA